LGLIDAIALGLAQVFRHAGALYVVRPLTRRHARHRTANLASGAVIGHHSLTGRSRRASVQPSGRSGHAYEGTVT
jgi:hypothetical protein